MLENTGYYTLRSCANRVSLVALHIFCWEYDAAIRAVYIIQKMHYPRSLCLSPTQMVKQSAPAGAVCLYRHSSWCSKPVISYPSSDQPLLCSALSSFLKLRRLLYGVGHIRKSMGYAQVNVLLER
jgi:hypothetical protein